MSKLIFQQLLLQSSMSHDLSESSKITFINLNKNISLSLKKKSYWPQTFEQYCYFKHQPKWEVCSRGHL